jgi:hypothetical protein
MSIVHKRNDARDYMGYLPNKSWLKLIVGDKENLTQHRVLNFKCNITDFYMNQCFWQHKKDYRSMKETM